MKPVHFLGSSLDEIRSFPEVARRMIGFQVDRLQRGLEPNDWKPMKTVGPGVRELRVREPSGQFRTVYLATLDEAVFILHAFQKKSQATSRQDIDIAAKRYGELMRKYSNDR